MLLDTSFNKAVLTKQLTSLKSSQQEKRKKEREKSPLLILSPPFLINPKCSSSVILPNSISTVQCYWAHIGGNRENEAFAFVLLWSNWVEQTPSLKNAYPSAGQQGESRLHCPSYHSCPNSCWFMQSLWEQYPPSDFTAFSAVFLKSA